MNNTKEKILSLQLNNKMNRQVIKYFPIYTNSSMMPIIWTIHWYHTWVMSYIHRGPWFTFPIYIFIYKKKRQLQKSTIYLLCPLCFFRILLVQSVINLENIGQKTLEKPEGVANIGQFRNMNHIGLKSENNDTQHRIKQWWGTRTPSERDLQFRVFVYAFILIKMPKLMFKLFFFFY